MMLVAFDEAPLALGGVARQDNRMKLKDMLCDNNSLHGIIPQ